MMDFLLHFDAKLPELFLQYGTWIYAIVFAILFCETGLVVTPFLPGDSMIFALGAFAAQGSLDMTILAVGLIFAAIAGDSANYWVGKIFGRGLLANPCQRIFKPQHYEKAHAFYERHGGKAIVLSRFVPIVRTFAPFVAGVGEMAYRSFFTYNIAGGVLWVALFLGGGYLLGTLPWIKGNFKVVTLAIIVLSVLPIVWELLKERLAKRALALSAVSNEEAACEKETSAEELEK